MYRFSGSPQWEEPMKIYRWLNTSGFRCSPASFIVCLWDLLHVRQKAGFKDNCICLNSMKKSLGIRPILAIRTSSPSATPVKMMLAKMKFFNRRFTISRVPFLSRGAFRLSRSVIGQPSLSVSSCTFSMKLHDVIPCRQNAAVVQPLTLSVVLFQVWVDLGLQFFSTVHHICSQCCQVYLVFFLLIL